MLAPRRYGWLGATAIHSHDRTMPTLVASLAGVDISEAMTQAVAAPAAAAAPAAGGAAAAEEAPAAEEEAEEEEAGGFDGLGSLFG